MNFRIKKELFAAALAIGLSFSAGNLQAQSIYDFKVGEDIKMAAKTHAPPSTQSYVDSFSVEKWNLSDRNAVYVTASQTGRIVFIESDWGGVATNAHIEFPGLPFGKTTLADIREKFGSNGFGFRSNIVRFNGQELTSFNYYQLKVDDDLVVVFVTTLPISSVPIVSGKPAPNTGQGHLDAVILADLSYLKDIWGEDRVFDANYHAVEWK